MSFRPILRDLAWLGLGLHHGCSTNDCRGEIPSALGSLTNLKYLFLYGNRLTGKIPSELEGNDLDLLGLIYCTSLES